MNPTISSFEVITSALRSDAFGMTTPKTLERQANAIIDALDYWGYTIAYRGNNDR